MNALETRTLEAFLRAISSYKKPLPSDIQQEIRRIGHALENHDTQSLREIPMLVQQDDLLKQQYDHVYRNLQKKYRIQERTKSLTTVANGSVFLGNENQIAQVFYADNLIESAQQFLSRLDSQLLDSQLSDNQQKIDLWERGNRVISLATGGAFLGVLLAQLPGAFLGGVLAAIYAWFSDSHVQSQGKSSSR
jgi:hypothetical protein